MKAILDLVVILVIITSIVISSLRLIYLLFKPKWLMTKFFINGPDKAEQTAIYIAIILVGIYGILYKLGYT